MDREASQRMPKARANPNRSARAIGLPVLVACALCWCPPADGRADGFDDDELFSWTIDAPSGFWGPTPAAVLDDAQANSTPLLITQSLEQVVNPTHTALAPAEFAALLRHSGQLSLSQSRLANANVEKLELGNATRSKGAVEIFEGVSLAGTRSEMTLGSTSAGGRSAMQVYDASAMVDAVKVADVALSFVGALRVASQGPVDAAPVRTQVTPMIGSGLRWQRGQAETRLMALGDASGQNEGLIELRADQVWRITAWITISVGYKHQITPTAERRLANEPSDSIILELRLKF